MILQRNKNITFEVNKLYNINYSYKQYTHISLTWPRNKMSAEKQSH